MKPKCIPNKGLLEASGRTLGAQGLSWGPFDALASFQVTEASPGHRSLSPGHRGLSAGHRGLSACHRRGRPSKHSNGTAVVANGVSCGNVCVGTQIMEGTPIWQNLTHDNVVEEDAAAAFSCCLMNCLASFESLSTSSVTLS